jgi:dCMP deaminase
MRSSIDTYYLDILRLVALRSTCHRRKVGAIITDGTGHVLSTGYNGVPSGVAHCIEEPCDGVFDPPGDTTRCMAVHAEINALLQCADLSRARVMYISCVPCFACAKAILNTAIRRIVVTEVYKDDRGATLLIDRGVELIVANV